MGFTKADLEKFTTKVSADLTTDCKVSTVKFKASFKRPDKDDIIEFQRHAMLQESQEKSLDERMESGKFLRDFVESHLIEIVDIEDSDYTESDLMRSYEVSSAIDTAFATALFPKSRSKN